MNRVFPLEHYILAVVETLLGAPKPVVYRTYSELVVKFVKDWHDEEMSSGQLLIVTEHIKSLKEWWKYKIKSTCKSGLFTVKVHLLDMWW